MVILSKNIDVYIICSSDYSQTNDYSSLPFVNNDLKLFSETLKKYLCISEDCIYSIHGLVTKKQYLNLLEKIINNDSEDRMVIFYYSGHGSNNKRKHRSYLKLGDGSKIELNEMIKKIENSNYQYRWLIFDCCYSGGVTLDYMINKNEIFSGTYINCSSSFEQKSYATTNNEYSFFTKCLSYSIKNRNESKNDISLDNINSLLKVIMENNNFIKQSYIKKSNFFGTIYFRKKPLKNSLSNISPIKYYYTCNDYKVVEPEAIHIGSLKKYRVSVITNKINESDINNISNSIIKMANDFNKYNNCNQMIFLQKKDVDYLMIYYYKDEVDYFNHNQLFNAEYSNKKLKVKKNDYYSCFKESREKNSIPNDELINQVRMYFQESIEIYNEACCCYDSLNNREKINDKYLENIRNKIYSIYLSFSDIKYSEEPTDYIYNEMLNYFSNLYDFIFFLKKEHFDLMIKDTDAETNQNTILVMYKDELNKSVEKINDYFRG